MRTATAAAGLLAAPKAVAASARLHWYLWELGACCSTDTSTSVSVEPASAAAVAAAPGHTNADNAPHHGQHSTLQQRLAQLGTPGSRGTPAVPSNPTRGAQQDVLTRAMQRQTEMHLMALIQQQRQQQQQQGIVDNTGSTEKAEKEEEEEEVDPTINPHTGEILGPRGKEPTRFGEYEVGPSQQAYQLPPGLLPRLVAANLIAIRPFLSLASDTRPNDRSRLAIGSRP